MSASYYVWQMVKKHKNRLIYSSKNEHIELCSNEQNDHKFDDGASANLESSGKVCRACTLEGFIPLIGNENNVDLIKALQTLSNIDINVNDELPKYLCQTCFEALIFSIKFRDLVQHSDEILRKQIIKQSSINHYNDFDCSNDIAADPASPEPSVEHVEEQQTDYTIKKTSVMTLKDLAAQEREITHYYETFDPQQNCRPCENCDLTFNSYKDFMEHTRTQEHKTAKKKCTVCAKMILAKNFKLHMRYHEKDYCHVCDICGKSFIAETQFRLHKQSHGTIEFHYICDVCPYRARFKHLLKKHMVIHSSEMPFKCSKCSKGFKFMSNLNRHKLTHIKKFSFNCSTCKKGFHHSKALETHVKVDHDGVKEHVCNICGKEFGYRNRMMKHQIKVHKREKLIPGRMALYLLQEKRQRDSELEVPKLRTGIISDGVPRAAKL